MSRSASREGRGAWATRAGALAIPAGALVALMTGCGYLGDPPGRDINTAFTDVLAPQEAAGDAEVDLSEVAAGEWTTALIICPGASTREIDEALGFEWSDGFDPGSAGFLSAVAFASDTDVIRYHLAGLEDDWYITFCPTLRAIEEEPLEHAVVRLPRASAEVTFRHSGGRRAESSYWYVPSEELNSLAAKGES